MSANHFKEIEIEDFIWKNISKNDLHKRGLHLPIGSYYRQVNIGCGIIDLLSVNVQKVFSSGHKYKMVFVKVFELKRRMITCDAVGQISRYMNVIEENFDELMQDFGMQGYHLALSGELIGESISDDATELVKNIHNLNVSFFGIGMQHGIEFQDLDKYANCRSFSMQTNPFRFRNLARVGGAHIHRDEVKKSQNEEAEQF